MSYAEDTDDQEQASQADEIGREEDLDRWLLGQRTRSWLSRQQQMKRKLAAPPETT